MFKIELQWKEFSVNLPMLDQKLRAEHPEYAGNQAHNILELWFTEEPSQEAKEEIVAYWEALDEESEEATSYKTQAQIEADAAADKAAKKASAAAKLEALGLTADEIAAILG